MDRDSFKEDEERKDVLKRIGVSVTKYSGSDGLRIISIAEDKADFSFVLNPKEINTIGTWDVAASEAILNGAGGILYFPDGKPLEYIGQRKIMKFGVAARDKGLAKKAIEEILK
jgi:3'-phosphoadenosine 5'-phosphosulfate (PAPS) 3'-phosphatase